MKNIILKILRTGYSKTEKYTVADLENYLFVLKGLFTYDKDAKLIMCSCNNFWLKNNYNNRMQLISDLYAMKRANIKDNYYYRILNRCANGDAYGIVA